MPLTETAGTTDIIVAEETITIPIIIDKVKMTDANRLTDDGEKIPIDTTNTPVTGTVGITDITVVEDIDNSFLL